MPDNLLHIPHTRAVLSAWFRSSTFRAAMLLRKHSLYVTNSSFYSEMCISAAEALDLASIFLQSPSPWLSGIIYRIPSSPDLSPTLP